MKKIKLFAGMIAFAGLGLTSCSSDDSNDNTNDVAIAGTYNLKEVNTETETDFNEDGTSNFNQMSESTCYNSSSIVLNTDNTFVYDMSNILIDEVNGTAACSENTVTGVWEIYAGSGNIAIINATYENENGDDVVITLNKSGDQLTLYTLFGQYPDRNAEGGAFYNDGEVELIFEK